MAPSRRGGKKPLTPSKKSSHSDSKPLSSSSPIPLEAKSSVDGAWYDVESILEYRIGEGGREEVEVSYEGFPAIYNEWLDPHVSVRTQSLPCENSDCILLLPGDLVLCFREDQTHSLHFDAEVVAVKRRRHDARGCRCKFLVRFQHDGAEHCIPLGKISRRPEMEVRTRQQQSDSEYAGIGPHPADSNISYPDVSSPVASSAPAGSSSIATAGGISKAKSKSAEFVASSDGDVTRPRASFSTSFSFTRADDFTGGKKAVTSSDIIQKTKSNAEQCTSKEPYGNEGKTAGVFREPAKDISACCPSQAKSFSPNWRVETSDGTPEVKSKAPEFALTGPCPAEKKIANPSYHGVPSPTAGIPYTASSFGSDAVVVTSDGIPQAIVASPAYVHVTANKHCNSDALVVTSDGMPQAIVFTEVDLMSSKLHFQFNE